MTQRTLDAELEQWVVAQAMAGGDPELVLARLRASGWSEQDAIDAVQSAVSRFLEHRAAETGVPMPVDVPVPTVPNGPSVLDAGDRQVHVLSRMKLPQLAVFGSFLSDGECDALIAMAGDQLSRSTTVDPATGGHLVHADRTSRGISFGRGCNALCRTIEARIARLLDWPLAHGEGLQLLNYGAGAQYRPHYDYFDPDESGSEVLTRSGGQRVATLVMYLNTPHMGGATIFPDAYLEVAAVKGNAVFFSYDRPHPVTRSLHAGAPVLEGEKWIATKWLRQRPCG